MKEKKNMNANFKTITKKKYHKKNKIVSVIIDYFTSSKGNT